MAAVVAAAAERGREGARRRRRRGRRERAKKRWWARVSGEGDRDKSFVNKPLNFPVSERSPIL